jgi:SAM-dependent methyltransferase
MEDNLRNIIEENVANTSMIYAVFASPLNKSDNKFKKITVKPISSNDKVIYQLEKFTDKQAFHENAELNCIVDKIMELADLYKNINIFTVEADYQVLVSKKGDVRIVKLCPTKAMSISTHNKTKKYIIPDNEPCDFLIELGVMNKDAKVLAKKYDKFKQINKFLEIVDDAVTKALFASDSASANDLKKQKSEYKIIDFGCGKAYLTFALYYYFNKIKKIDVQIVGLDLKKEVIDFCNSVAKKLNYSKLKFENGDIKDYNTNQAVDMVVTLHACDNATDAALVKAIKWNTNIILSVPCCQHEFFNKIDNVNLEPMLKHGLIKERISSLVTDSLRSLFLETKGYKVQLVEFVDMEHTPKNILIRATKANYREEAINEYENFKKFWSLEDIFIEKYFIQEG